MNKKELLERVAKRVGMSSAETLRVLDAILDTVKEELGKGEKVALRNFGTFSIVCRKERRGVNPLTKQPIIIPFLKVVKFYLTKSVKIK